MPASHNGTSSEICPCNQILLRLCVPLGGPGEQGVLARSVGQTFAQAPAEGEINIRGKHTCRRARCGRGPGCEWRSAAALRSNGDGRRAGRPQSERIGTCADANGGRGWEATGLAAATAAAVPAGTGRRDRRRGVAGGGVEWRWWRRQPPAHAQHATMGRDARAWPGARQWDGKSVTGERQRRGRRARGAACDTGRGRAPPHTGRGPPMAQRGVRVRVE
jgi:hypothetical protein